MRALCASKSSKGALQNHCERTEMCSKGVRDTEVENSPGRRGCSSRLWLQSSEPYIQLEQRPPQRQGCL